MSTPSPARLRQRIIRLLAETPATDIHTHLFSPAFGSLLLRGIDDLLTYHYLIAEFFRWHQHLDYDVFFSLPREAQAAAVWQTLFLDHSPLSESSRGLLTSLHTLRCPLRSRNLDKLRAFFAQLSPSEHVDLCMRAVNIDTLVMTNNPFDPAERACWERGVPDDPRFRTALRIDNLLTAWPAAAQDLRTMGFRASAELSPSTRSAIRSFLLAWINRIKPLYLMASLPPTFSLPSPDPGARILTDIVLPLLRERNLVMALMIGVERQVNPALRLAGDSIGRMNINTLVHLARSFPTNKFLVTILSRENQHELCVVARKFRNLMPFGCWWFLNSPFFIEELTRMRLEWLGLTFIPQHSDARVLDQIIYKWLHTKQILAEILTQKYATIEATGWKVSNDDLRRDISDLLRNNFWRFLE
ncbi:MAG: glucuronate isomerase [bacterium]|nr:glucuronate isomerase [bacterium]